jgi:hypothetical protein
MFLSNKEIYSANGGKLTNSQVIAATYQQVNNSIMRATNETGKMKSLDWNRLNCETSQPAERRY